VDWSLARLPHWLVGSTNWAGFNWTTTGALPAYTVVTVLVVWQGFPFIAVSVLAGLKTVPADLLEAARVDGAGPWHGFWRITFPLLKPIFLVLLLLSVIWDFNVFTQTYLLTGGLGNRDEFNLSLYLYDKAFTFPPSYGLGGALALILTVILLIITVGYVRASVRQGALSGPRPPSGSAGPGSAGPGSAGRGPGPARGRPGRPRPSASTPSGCWSPW
jgi:N,N'-diacetylchitobiose transport system permease protein